MNASEVITRAATHEDLRGIRAIVDAEEEPPDAARGGFPDALDAYYLFLIEHGEVRIAEDGSSAIAFGATIDSGRGPHLADLFVTPSRQGAGIGRRLLEELFLDRWPRTTFSSDDPRALPLYVRLGMQPLWPNLYLSGDARRLPGSRFGLEVVPAGPDDVAHHEAGWCGVHRPLVHRYWASQPAAAAFAVADGAEVVAAGHARSRLRGGGRWINSFVVGSRELAHDATLLALHEAADDHGRIGACVPGPHPILPTLLAAGFRIVDRDTYQASGAALVDPVRTLVNTGFL